MNFVAILCVYKQYGTDCRYGHPAVPDVAWQRYNEVRPVRLQRELGIVPVKTLYCRCSADSFVNNPNCVGTVPLNLLPRKNSFCTLVMLPIAVDMVPVRLFPPKLKEVIFGRV